MRLVYHEMSVYGHIGVFIQRFEHRNTEGNVGHEHSVHNVEVKNVGARLFHFIAIGSEPRKIRRKNRRSNENHKNTPFKVLFLLILSQSPRSFKRVYKNYIIVFTKKHK